MAEFGEFVFVLVGIFFTVMSVRLGWIAAIPALMWLAKRLGLGSDQMQWQRGTAKGRPPLRYVTDGWGRIVYAEIDPDHIDTKEGRADD